METVHQIKVIGILTILMILPFSILSTKSEKKIPPNPLFSVTLLYPVSSPVVSYREPMLSQITDGMRKVGIETEIIYLSWAAFANRTTKKEVRQYFEGGYDICILGRSLGTSTGHLGQFIEDLYGAEAIPPEGSNLMYWSPISDQGFNEYRAQESNDLISVSLNTLNVDSLQTVLWEWQKIWYDAMPNILLYNNYDIHVISDGLFGYDPVQSNPLDSLETFWVTTDFLGLSDQVVVATNSLASTFNPILATDRVDFLASSVVFDKVLGYTPSKDTVLPFDSNRTTWMEENYETTEYLALYPRLAPAKGTYSTDGQQYDITIRDNVFWHDGHQLDAWDVAFTFQASLQSAFGPSLTHIDLVTAFGMDNDLSEEMHGNYSFSVSDDDSDGFFEHLIFNFTNSSARFELDYLGLKILPEHILGDPLTHGLHPNGTFDSRLWQVQPRKWRSHSTTTSRVSDPGNYSGPIGCGPYVFKELNFTDGIITLQKFKDIKWNGSNWISASGVSYWNVESLVHAPDLVKIVVTTSDFAIAGIKEGSINLLDPHAFSVAHIFEELQIESSIRLILSPEPSFQAMYFNPKFEQNGTFPLNKKGVRHAISHVIPRENITTNLFNGLALSAYTPLPVTSWAAIPRNELISYKTSLIATDGSQPLALETTAFDSYSFLTALDWLESEGYDVRFYREQFKPPPLLDQLVEMIVAFPNFFFGGFLLIGILLVFLIKRFRLKQSPKS